MPFVGIGTSPRKSGCLVAAHIRAEDQKTRGSVHSGISAATLRSFRSAGHSAQVGDAAFARDTTVAVTVGHTRLGAGASRTAHLSFRAATLARALRLAGTLKDRRGRAIGGSFRDRRGRWGWSVRETGNGPCVASLVLRASAQKGAEEENGVFHRHRRVIAILSKTLVQTATCASSSDSLQPWYHWNEGLAQCHPIQGQSQWTRQAAQLSPKICFPPSKA